ncbi:HAD-IA family hydrolase [Halofilum ochraceum]|uniref:HAD-IA family hydrolase n=1 Tax=Halofilum ochraceum TaxID=1611323 RepID=UPI000829D062|nr:HAD-IA family hydrolase [Halofilum ochraceum]
MKRIELVVFDWDGTLMDSAARIVESVQAATGAAGLPPRSGAEIREIIGLGMGEAIKALYPEEPAERHARLAATYRDAFVRAVADRPADLFPGVESVLGTLEAERRMLAVATGKSRSGLQRDLERAGISGRFVASRTVDESPSKPDPHMLQEIMALCGVGPDATLLVGDTLFDLEMAARAGVPALGVAWGVHAAERLWQAEPLAVLERIEHLPERLRQFEHCVHGPGEP